MLKKKYTLFILLLAVVTLLIFLKENLVSESEEQEKRKPGIVSQKEASLLLSLLNGVVVGERHDPKLLSSYYVGQGRSLEESSEGSYELIMGECLRDEHEYLQIESSLVKVWANSWLQQDVALFTKILKKGASVASFDRGKGSLERSDNIEIYRWGKVEESTRPMESIQNYLSSFEKIEDIELVTQKINVPMGSRNDDLSLAYVEAEVRFDLRGFSKKQRREDRGHLSVTFEQINKKKAEGWKISKIEVLDMETLQTSNPSFVEITKKVKLPVASYNRVEAIRRGGYSISSADYDNDGILDLLVGAYGPLQLFKGLKSGGYKEVKDSGIQPHLYVKSTVFADFNNDGYQDLLVVRFIPSNEKPLFASLRSDIYVYENLGGGKFRKMQPILENGSTDHAMPSAVADFNNDGLLDFYIGYPGNKDFSSLGVDFEFKKSLKAQGIYINQGDFHFVPQKMSKENNYEKYTYAQKVFPHSAAAIDFNQDGSVDIVVVDDRGNLSPLYQNTGEGSFVQRNKDWNVENSGVGMGIASADLNNDGLTDLLVTNVSFNAASRLVNHCLSSWHTDIKSDLNYFSGSDIKVFSGTKFRGKKRFVEVSKSIGLNNMGDGLAGVELLDYNNDGYIDLYVANGLWSGTNRYNDLSSHLARLDVDAWRVLDEEGRTSETQSQVMNILSSYRGDIFGKGKSKERLSLGGLQRNRLFKNLGDGTFLEVGFLEGVDSIADGYVISKADIDRDGRLDLILRNGDPGTSDVKYEPVQIFKNKHKNDNSLRVNLVGSGSNRDAIGAELVLEVQGIVQTQQLIANLGTSQSEKTIHFGLGKSREVKKLTVKWPSGKITTYKGIKPGVITITEDDMSLRRGVAGF